MVKFLKNFQNCKFVIFGQFGRPPRHKILGEIDPLGSISGEDKGGMGFPLALKNFLTLKIRPERSEGRKFLNFGLSCLNKNCSKFFQIFGNFRPLFWLKKSKFYLSKNVIIQVMVNFPKNPQVHPPRFRDWNMKQTLPRRFANASFNIFSNSGIKFLKIFFKLKILSFGQFWRPPRHKILGEIDPLGSISGEDKGGMGFPLALKNFLTWKFAPSRARGEKILNFGVSCLNKNCSKFVQFWKF